MTTNDHDHDGDGHPDHAAEDHDHAEHDHGHHQGPLARTNAELLQFPEKEITTVLVKYKNRTNFQALSMPRSINENTDLQAASPAIEINRLYSMIGSGRKMLQWLAILIGIISCISTFIVLYKSMRERKYELALIRSLQSSYKYSFTGWYFMKQEWWLLLISLFIGLLSALIPAIGAAKMDIHATLNEGK